MNPKCCLKSEEKLICICSHEEMLSVIGKKWAVLILRIINTHGTAGYNEILTQISGITPKAFGDKLKILKSNGFMEKKIVSSKPLRTEYSLTPSGENLLANLKPFLSKTEARI